MDKVTTAAAATVHGSLSEAIVWAQIKLAPFRELCQTRLTSLEVKLVEGSLAPSDHAPDLTVNIYASPLFERNRNSTAWAGPVLGLVGPARVEEAYKTPVSARLRLAGKRKHASDDGGQARGALAQAAQEGPAGNVGRHSFC